MARLPVLHLSPVAVQGNEGHGMPAAMASWCGAMSMSLRGYWGLIRDLRGPQTRRAGTAWHSALPFATSDHQPWALPALSEH